MVKITNEQLIINRRSAYLDSDVRNCTKCGDPVPLEACDDDEYYFESELHWDEAGMWEELFIYCPKCQ